MATGPRLCPDFGAPEKATIDHLGPGAENADPGVKYYSGTGTYTEDVDVPAGWMRPSDALCSIWARCGNWRRYPVNGRSLGIAWHPPYRIDVTGAVKPGPTRSKLR